MKAGICELCFSAACAFLLLWLTVDEARRLLKDRVKAGPGGQLTDSYGMNRVFGSGGWLVLLAFVCLASIGSADLLGWHWLIFLIPITFVVFVFICGFASVPVGYVIWFLEFKDVISPNGTVMERRNLTDKE